MIKPLNHAIVKRSWFAATCKQTPAIQNFLECLKMYFSGADMSVDDKESTSYTMPQERITGKPVAPAIDDYQNAVANFSQVHDIRNYQY